MVPIYIHRYIPSKPAVDGNPVFSVVTYDMVYYGNDLPSYLEHEFGIPNPYPPPTQPRDIQPWSRLVR
jgi:hypothetical protein